MPGRAFTQTRVGAHTGVGSRPFLQLGSSSARQGTSLPQPLPLSPASMKVHAPHTLGKAIPAGENLGEAEWMERGPFPPSQEENHRVSLTIETQGNSSQSHVQTLLGDLP